MKKIIPLLLLLILIAALSGCFRKTQTSGPATLTVYGLDNSAAFDSIIQSYRGRQPDVTVKYKKFNNAAQYEDLMINEIAEGEGPDVFYIHNTWLPRHTKKIVPLISESLTPQVFGEVFVNVAKDDFVQPDPRDGVRKIYALPLYVDTLALYYNKKQFEEVIPERGKPSALWSQFKQDVEKLRKETGGVLERGGVAMGRSELISRAAEIFYAMLLQNGVMPYDAEFKQVQLASGGSDVLEEYASYAEKSSRNYSFSQELVPAASALKEVEAFLSGTISSIFGYSDLYGRLENDLKNVKTRAASGVDFADIGVAPLPQVAEEGESRAALASYYGLAVSRVAKNQSLAWDFVQFATSKESATSFHEKTRRPAARRDLIEEQKGKPITEVFASQLGIARSFRAYSWEKWNQLIAEAIANVNGGQSASSALNAAQTSMNAMLQLEAPTGLYPKPPPVKK